MCGRITLTTPDVLAVAAMLGARVSPEAAATYRPRYNAAPSDSHLVMTAERVLVPAVWGFPGGRINARSEKPLWGERVVVAADGFYEWTGPRDARRPIWFRPRGGGLLHLAGLADLPPDGRLAFVVLTTEATGAVARIHHRMPLIAPPDWLNFGDTIRNSRGAGRQDEFRMVSPNLPELTATEVSPRVNDVRNDDPSLLEPPPQLSLL